MRTREQIIEEANLLAGSLAPHDNSLILRTLAVLASLVSDLAALTPTTPARKRK